MKARQRIKLFIILGVEFIAIAVMLLLIFFAGKQVYTVEFDLNGGTLLSGDLVQKVTQGHNATAPTATKEGCYFLKWSGSYNKVTKDVYVKAIWEYETSPGIDYNIGKSSNYCTISGSFEDIQGDVYIGAYKGDYKVLGIDGEAFKDRDGITSIHLLDGILTIGEGAFAGCTSLESIEMPATTVSMGTGVFAGCESLKSIKLPADLKTLGDNAFEGCTSLEKVVLPEGLKTIGANAFAGCTSLKEVILPESVETIEDGAFAGCTALEEATVYATTENIGSGVFDVSTVKITIYSYDETQRELPETWAADWNLANATFEWEYLENPEEDLEESDEETNK